MSERREASAGRLGDVGVAVLQGVAVVGAALWFRDATERYAIVAVVASIAALALRWARAGGRRVDADQRELDRGTAVLFALSALLVVTPALRVARVRTAHPGDAAVAEVARAVAPTLRALEQTAKTALARGARAGLTPRRRFAALADLADSGDAHRGERAVALLDARGAPWAWAGTWRVRPDSLDLRARTGVARSPFYVVLYATAADGARRAVAATVLHAEPPADDLARALDAGVLRESGLRGLEVRAISQRDGVVPPLGAGWSVMDVPGTTDRLALRAVSPDPAAVRAQLLEDARRVAAPGLTLMTILAAAALWRLGVRTQLARAFASTAGLTLPLGVLALTPLGSLSNATQLFDPSVYFSPLGGPLTATLGALSATGGVAVLAVATAWRGAVAAGDAGWRGTVRGLGGLAVAVLVAGTGVWLVAQLARGISPPPAGTSVGLFVAWEGAFCLVIAAILLWITALVRPLLDQVGGHRLRRCASVLAITGPLLAAMIALVGTMEWRAPDGWPAWYPALWIAPAFVVVLVRVERAVVPAAIAVAGLAASTLVWGATTERQVALAERDVRALAVPDADALVLLARFGRSLALDAAPAGDAAGASLLRRYATSPLADAGYPVTLARWDPAVAGLAAPVERVGFVLWAVDSAAVASAIRMAVSTGTPITRAIAADPGAATLLAVPQRDGRVATVTMFPRAQFVTLDPLGVLLGGGRTRGDEPPYLLSLLRQGHGASVVVGPSGGAVRLAVAGVARGPALDAGRGHRARGRPDPPSGRAGVGPRRNHARLARGSRATRRAPGVSEHRGRRAALVASVTRRDAMAAAEPGVALLDGQLPRAADGGAVRLLRRADTRLRGVDVRAAQRGRPRKSRALGAGDAPCCGRGRCARERPARGWRAHAARRRRTAWRTAPRVRRGRAHDSERAGAAPAGAARSAASRPRDVECGSGR